MTKSERMIEINQCHHHPERSEINQPHHHPERTEIHQPHRHPERMEINQPHRHPERMEINQPRVARNELPWADASLDRNPERVASVVAQVSNLLYRSASSLCMPRSMRR